MTGRGCHRSAGARLLIPAIITAAQPTSQAEREKYANDEQLVLLAASGPANEAKGDEGPADWMPPTRPTERSTPHGSWPCSRTTDSP